MLAGVVIESLLAARLWLQVTNQDMSRGLNGLVYDASNFFVEPFSSLDTAASTKTTGIIEYSTLMAMEVVLVAGLAAVFAILFGSWTVGMIVRGVAGFRRRRALAQARPQLQEPTSLDSAA